MPPSAIINPPYVGYKTLKFLILSIKSTDWPWFENPGFTPKNKTAEEYSKYSSNFELIPAKNKELKM